MNERTSLATNRAVANTNMIQVGIDFEANSAAVTGAVVGLFHDIRLTLGGALQRVALELHSRLRRLRYSTA
ncbi:MAG: hypothetical protein ACXWIH_07090 [Burkholderiales bacterium]